MTHSLAPDPTPKLKRIMHHDPEDVPPKSLPHINEDGTIIFKIEVIDETYLEKEKFYDWVNGKIAPPDYWYSLEWEPAENTAIRISVINDFPDFDEELLAIFDKVWQYRLLVETKEAQKLLDDFISTYDERSERFVYGKIYGDNGFYMN